MSDTAFSKWLKQYEEGGLEGLNRADSGIKEVLPEGNGNKTPEGFPEDNTRLPSFYDPTYNYFKSIGIVEI